MPVRIPVFRVSAGTGFDAVLVALIGFFPGWRWPARVLARRAVRELVAGGAWPRTPTCPHYVIVPGGGFEWSRAAWEADARLHPLAVIELQAVIAYTKGLQLSPEQERALS